MTVQVEAVHAQGGFTLDAAFSAQGGLIALFGRSGSGKTTLVNIVAGLVRPSRGRVVVGDRTLLDTQHGVDVPVHARAVGYVFQEGRLLPHLSVRSNLLYGAYLRRLPDRIGELARVVEMLGIGHLLTRRPGSLSGGEKQRVAIGRALLARPRILLMDEPLASLDEARKAEILPFIERLRDEARVPILYVSHSLAEVTRLATTLVLVDQGRVVAQGPLTELMSRADLHRLTSRKESGAVVDAHVAEIDAGQGLATLATPAGPIRVPGGELRLGQAVRLRMRARDLLVATERPRGLSARNILPATVKVVRDEDPAQAEVELLAGTATLFARLTRHAVDELALVPGKPVFAVIKSVALAGADPGEPEEI